jgi:hypothetical protein
VGWLRRRKETLNEKLMREAGLSAVFDDAAEPAAFPPDPPPPRFQAPGSGSWASEHAFLLRPREHDFFRPVVAHGIEGEQVSFDVLPDGTVLVEQEEGDTTLAPLADAVEEELPPPYRARAVRQGVDLWAVGARKIEVVSLPGQNGEKLELVMRDGGRTLTVDGKVEFGSVHALEELAGARSEDYVVRAERLDGDWWEVKIDPL